MIRMRSGRRRARRARGFTLLEIMIALVIVGTLLAFMVGGYRSYVLRARAAATVQLITVVRVGLVQFQADCGGLPRWDGRAGDPGLCHAPARVADLWNGPYLRSWPESTPLGGTLVYLASNEPGSEEPPKLRVDGLTLDEAETLASLARRTFGDQTITVIRNESNPAGHGTVSCLLGEPSRVLSDEPEAPEMAGQSGGPQRFRRAQ